MTTKKTPSKILADHKQHGKVFTPPLLSLGEFKDVSWFEEVVPELLWIACLVREHGIELVAANLSLQLAKAAAATIPAKPKPFFALTSAYASLSTDQFNDINKTLGNSRSTIASTLRPLFNLYPKCPLLFLASSNPSENIVNERISATSDVATIRNALNELTNKLGTLATFTQANAVYIAFVNDQLKVFEGLALANFPVIESYPNTEESIRVASAVRGTVNMMVGHNMEKHPSFWISYFWNRGLEIQPCELKYQEDKDDE